MLGTVAYGAQEALQLSHRLNWNQSATNNCSLSSDFTVRETKKFGSNMPLLYVIHPYFLHELQDIKDSYTNFHEAMVPIYNL